MSTLRVRKGAQSGIVFAVSISHKPTVLGREGHAHIGLGDARASRKHAQLWLEAGQWILEDLKSSNGTFLDGARIERAVLEDGSTIQIGNTLLAFHEPETPPLPRAEIHGARLVQTLREASGVYSFLAQQTALDREVRCDWISPDRHEPGSLAARIEPALEAARKLVDAGFLPLMAGEINANEAFAILKGAPPTLEEKLGEVLRLPLALRIDIFRQILDLALERATWEALRSPIALSHIAIEIRPDGAQPAVFLPALELSAIVADEIGDCPHLSSFAPYLAPEQGEGRGAKTSASPLASTLYNVGAIGYHLIVGQRPMGDGSVASMLESHRTLRPAPASLMSPLVPAALSDILDRMLEKDPARRPGGRLEVMTALESASSEVLPQQRTAPQQPAPPRAIAGVSAPRPTPPPPVVAAIPAAAPIRPGAAPQQPRPQTRPVAPARQSAAATAPTKRPAAPAKSKLPGIVILPLWVLAWVACFYAARILSKLVFESLGA